MEVGVGGFPSNSLWRMTSLLGIWRKPMKLIVKKMAEAAKSTSSWLWLRSGERRQRSKEAKHDTIDLINPMDQPP